MIYSIADMYSSTCLKEEAFKAIESIGFGDGFAIHKHPGTLAVIQTE